MKDELEKTRKEKKLEKLKEVVKEFIVLVVLAWGSDYLTYHALVDGENFRELIGKLKKLVNWTEEDEERVIEFAKRMAEEPKGKTTKDKVSWLEKCVKIAIPTALGLATGIGVATAFKKNKKDKNAGK